MEPPKYPSVVCRNFVPYFAVNNPGVRYLRHPSGVIVITLACDSNAASAKKIESFVWEVSQKKKHGVDRSKLEISGKSKRGGLQVFPESKLCILKYSDGSERVIRVGIRATLVEVNDERLAEDPNLARTASDGHGFLAIVVPGGGDAHNLLHVPKHLTNEEDRLL